MGWGWTHQIDDSVAGLAWSPDGNRLAALSAAGELWMFTDEGTATSAENATHVSGGMHLAWSVGVLATAGQEGMVKLWDTDEELSSRLELQAGKGWVETLACSPDGALIAATAGKSLRVWNLAGECLLHFEDHASTVLAIAWRPDSKGIATGCYGAVRIFRLGEPKPHQVIEWKGSLISLAWSPNARYLAGGAQDNSIRFWKLPHRPGEELQMTGYSSKVRELSWDATSRHLGTGNGEMVTIWDVSGKGPAGRTPEVLEHHEARLSALQFHPTGGLIASGDLKGEVCVWKYPGAKKPVWIGSLESEVTRMAWNPVKTGIAAGSSSGLVGARDAL